MAAQLAREAGAHVFGTGRAAHRLAALDFGAHEFVDLENDELAEVGGVDLVFDVFGGELGRRSARLVRPGGTFVTVAGRPDARPAEGRSVDFVVVSDRRQLTEIAQRVRSGRLRPHIGRIAELADAASALDPATRAAGKTVIRIRP
jgi:NADPH:quinone reductase-like Zn-dependent oxidoreductase